MMRLGHYLNKTVTVCIPWLFEDQKPRAFKLVGVEDCGLWLEGEALVEALQPADETKPRGKTVVAFFPFSHIVYVTAGSQPLLPASLLASTPPKRKK